MERKRKRDRDLQKTIVHFLSSIKNYDRVLKDQSLEELKESVRRKLGLGSHECFTLSHARNGDKVALEDDDDYEAFMEVARISSEIQVMILRDEDKTGPSAIIPSPSPASNPEVVLPIPIDDSGRKSKRRRVETEEKGHEGHASVSRGNSVPPMRDSPRVDTPDIQISAPKPTKSKKSCAPPLSNITHKDESQTSPSTSFTTPTQVKGKRRNVRKGGDNSETIVSPHDTSLRSAKTPAEDPQSKKLKGKEAAQGSLSAKVQEIYAVSEAPLSLEAATSSAKLKKKRKLDAVFTPPVTENNSVKNSSPARPRKKKRSVVSVNESSTPGGTPSAEPMPSTENILSRKKRQGPKSKDINEALSTATDAAVASPISAQLPLLDTIASTDASMPNARKRRKKKKQGDYSLIQSPQQSATPTDSRLSPATANTYEESKGGRVVQEQTFQFPSEAETRPVEKRKSKKSKEAKQDASLTTTLPKALLPSTDNDQPETNNTNPSIIGTSQLDAKLEQTKKDSGKLTASKTQQKEGDPAKTRATKVSKAEKKPPAQPISHEDLMAAVAVVLQKSKERSSSVAGLSDTGPSLAVPTTTTQAPTEKPVSQEEERPRGVQWPVVVDSKEIVVISSRKDNKQSRRSRLSTTWVPGDLEEGYDKLDSINPPQPMGIQILAKSPISSSQHTVVDTPCSDAPIKNQQGFNIISTENPASLVTGLSISRAPSATPETPTPSVLSRAAPCVPEGSKIHEVVVEGKDEGSSSESSSASDSGEDEDEALPSAPEELSLFKIPQDIGALTAEELLRGPIRQLPRASILEELPSDSSDEDEDGGNESSDNEDLASEEEEREERRFKKLAQKMSKRFGDDSSSDEEIDEDGDEVDAELAPQTTVDSDAAETPAQSPRPSPSDLVETSPPEGLTPEEPSGKNSSGDSKRPFEVGIPHPTQPSSEELVLAGLDGQADISNEELSQPALVKELVEGESEELEEQTPGVVSLSVEVESVKPELASTMAPVVEELIPSSEPGEGLASESANIILKHGASTLEAELPYNERVSSTMPTVNLRTISTPLPASLKKLVAPTDILGADIALHTSPPVHEYTVSDDQGCVRHTSPEIPVRASSHSQEDPTDPIEPSDDLNGSQEPIADSDPIEMDATQSQPTATQVLVPTTLDPTPGTAKRMKNRFGKVPSSNVEMPILASQLLVPSSPQALRNLPRDLNEQPSMEAQIDPSLEGEDEIVCEEEGSASSEASRPLGTSHQTDPPPNAQTAPPTSDPASTSAPVPKRRGRPPKSQEQKDRDAAEKKVEKERKAAERERKAAEKKALQEQKTREREIVQAKKVGSKKAISPTSQSQPLAILPSSSQSLPPTQTSMMNGSTAIARHLMTPSKWAALPQESSTPASVVDETLIDELRSSSPSDSIPRASSVSLPEAHDNHTESRSQPTSTGSQPLDGSQEILTATFSPELARQLYTPVPRTHRKTTRLFLPSSSDNRYADTQRALRSTAADLDESHSDDASSDEKGVESTPHITDTFKKPLRPVPVWAAGSKFRRLSDLASQPLFSPKLPPTTPLSTTTIVGGRGKKPLYDASQKDDDDSSSSSSDSDSEEEGKSHIPKHRRAGVQAKKSGLPSFNA